MRKGVGDWEAVSAEQMPGPNRDKPPDEPRQISMPCHSCSAGKRVSSLSQTHMYIHTHSDGDCPLLFCFQFFFSLPYEKFTQLWKHISQMAAPCRKKPSSRRENIVAGLTSVWKRSHWVFLWFPEKYPPPLRNYYQTHQSPWSANWVYTLLHAHHV